MGDDDQAPGRPLGPSAENRRLAVLLGTWRFEGQTVATLTEPAITIKGFDTYEWLAGEFFMVHRVDVRMNDERVEVIEMIGPHDPATGTYPMRSFDNQGNFTTMHASVSDDGVWTFVGESERATLTIAEDRTSMRARWERLDETSTWRHWMDMRFTRSS
jgi:hypothetical protein